MLYYPESLLLYYFHALSVVAQFLCTYTYIIIILMDMIIWRAMCIYADSIYMDLQYM